MTRLATLVIARPRRVLAPAVFFLVAAGVFGGPVAGLLSTGDDFNDPGAESVAAEERLASATGADRDAEVVVLVEPARRAAGVAAKLREVPGIARAVPGDVSRDGTKAYVAGFVRDGVADEDVAERAEAAFAADRGVLIGGGALAGPAVGDQVSEDLGRAEMLAFPRSEEHT